MINRIISPFRRKSFKNIEQHKFKAEFNKINLRIDELQQRFSVPWYRNLSTINSLIQTVIVVAITIPSAWLQYTQNIEFEKLVNERYQYDSKNGIVDGKIPEVQRGVQQQVIALSSGWKMISSYEALSNPKLDEIFGPLFETQIMDIDQNKDF